MLATLPAQAAPTLYCKDGPGINLVTTGCISGESRAYPGGGDGIYSNAGGGDPEAAIEAAILGATGVAVNISLYDKSDGNPLLFEFTPNSGTSLEDSFSGLWKILDGTEIAYITVKAANSFALYEIDPESDTGTYTTLGILNNGGQQPKVSHISFWTVPGNEVPVPGLFSLLGAGLIGLGIAARRRQRFAQ